MLLYKNREAFTLSNCLFYVPDESSKTKHRAIFIKMMQLFEKRVYLTVFHYGDNSACKSRPRMTPIVRFTLIASTPLDIAK